LFCILVSRFVGDHIAKIAEMINNASDSEEEMDDKTDKSYGSSSTRKDKKSASPKLDSMDIKGNGVRSHTITES